MVVINRRERQAGIEELTEERPRTRADCVDGPRPCPWVGCRYHLFCDVKSSGTLDVYHDTDPLELPETCALDVAVHPYTLDEVAQKFGVTRERIRQIEEIALAKFRDAGMPVPEEMTA